MSDMLTVVSRYLLITIVLLAASQLHAVQPQIWRHATESDFEGGDTENVVITDLGRIRLANRTDTIGDMPEHATAIFDIQEISGEWYIAAGPDGKLLKLTDEDITPVIDLTGEQVFALGQYDGRLLLAISGEPARLALLEHDQLNTIVSLDGIRYIWDVIVSGNTIFLATGTEGYVIAVTPDDLVIHDQPENAARNDADNEQVIDQQADNHPGENLNDQQDPPFVQPGVRVILDSMQTNVLCLATDKDGRIFAGTDTDGLVYRLTPSDDHLNYDAFVLYDADEPEIGDIVVMDDGSVYAGTADAEQARPGRLDQPQQQPAGRPEKDNGPPAPPEPPAPPMPDEIHLQPADQTEQQIQSTPLQNDRTDNSSDSDHNADQQRHDSTETDNPIEQAGRYRTDTLTYNESEKTIGDSDVTTDNGNPLPTSDQYDRLREVVRSRLDAAKKSGVLQAGPGESQLPIGRQAAAGPSRSKPVMPQRPAKDGNAVYRIDSLGFVSEVFRESVMILGLLHVDHQLLITTGNAGQIYSVSLADNETAMLADLDAEQITAIVTGEDNRILLGTSNPAALISFSSELAGRGTYTGTVLDAAQVSLWGTFKLTVDVPVDCSVTIETRSGNVADPDSDFWSRWSQAQVFMPGDELPTLQPREMTVQSPPARFLQYRITCTGDDNRSPHVDVVELAYITPNIKPRINSIAASYPDEDNRQGGPLGGRAGAAGARDDEPPSTSLNVEWEAEDDNNDELIFKLEYQPAGSDTWLVIDDDIHQNSYEWQTRQVPDGRYLLRISADDRLNNPGDMAKTASRRSDPVLVDHTPPALDNLTLKRNDDTLTLSAIARDDLSPIKSIAYVLDSEKEYLPVLPDDLIFDSTYEPWHAIISDLSPDAAVITLRILDRRGNAYYESRVIR